MKDVYSSSKIVIDDANPVTAPWGSVNSRVFDAVAAGRLVVSNGILGAHELFGDKMPTFNSTEELHQLLELYLSDPDLLHRKTTALREDVIRYHTYDIRAKELEASLLEIGWAPYQARASPDDTCSPTLPSKPQAINRTHMCVLTRTHPGQNQTIEPLVRSLLLAVDPLPGLTMDVFLFNTDPERYASTLFMETIAKAINTEVGYCGVHVVKGFKTLPLPTCYAYDYTDLTLKYVLDATTCSHILVTNGNNMYELEFVSTVYQHMQQGRHIVGVDFMTHHPRGPTNKINTVVKVAMKRGHIELGGVVVSRAAIQRTNAMFLPQGINTINMFARDFFFFKALLAGLQHDNDVVLVHKTLLHHM